MNSRDVPPVRRPAGPAWGGQHIATRLVIAGAALFLLAALLPAGAEVRHLNVTQPGGMPGQPVMTDIQTVSNGVKISWDGPPGQYQVYQKSNSLDAKWLAWGKATNLIRTATITKLYSNAFFRVSSPAPQYAGSRSCVACHLNVCRYVTNTPHASAYSNVEFKSAGGQTNTSCLPCHTVGFGFDSGFKFSFPNGRLSYSTNLAGVQCENCHGPAGAHVANENDPVYRPRVDVAAQVCGGCHNTTHFPTFNEWSGSGHATVVEDMSPASRVDSCGRCHSGTARLALMQGKSALTVTNDANVGITCVVCHDPHQTNSNPYQLRNPMSSTNDFFLTTSEVFTNKYNANKNINLCAQCHNHRGAAWTVTSRPPHHSLQYNMMLGSVGELPGGTSVFAPGTHALSITNQCVGCHLEKSTDLDISHPGTTGHSFAVTSYDSCVRCHPLPELLTVFTTFAVTNRIAQLKGYLDLWATLEAPTALWSKYGVRSWEYTTIGGLSSGGSGPTTAEQALIPDKIKKARYNIYLVFHDGSYGVHNANHTIDLLDAAEQWIVQELNP